MRPGKMASSGVPNHNDDHAVVINMYPRGVENEAYPTKRQFKLDHDSPSIRIGRASKVASKGFMPSEYNAWFDSPVMSRNHAELLLDSQSTPKGVFIKDIGSLHGTFHTPNFGNGPETRLEHQRLVKLATGDSLRFGTDIFRSKQAFPPYVVDVILPEHEDRQRFVGTMNDMSNRAYACYNPDDVDEDEDDDDRDDESVIEMGAYPFKTHITRGPSIDLTQDDVDDTLLDDINRKYRGSVTVPPVSSSIIDLTSEPGEPDEPEGSMEPREQEEHAEYEEPDEHEDPEEHEDHENDEQHKEPNPPHEPEATSSSYESLSPYHPAMFDSSAPRLPRYPLAAADSEVGKSLIDLQANEGDPDADLPSIPDFSERRGNETRGEHFVAVDADNDSAMTEDSAETTSDEDSEEDNGSKTSETNEYAKPYDSMDDDDDENIDYIPYSNDETSSSDDDSTEILSDLSSSAPASPLESPPMLSTSKDFVVGDSSAGLQNPFPPFAFVPAADYTTSSVAVRQPSPSNAAMAKSCTLYSQESSSDRAQALGAKTGKFEYFAARESNRSSLADTLPPPPTSAVRETLNEDFMENVIEMETDGWGADGRADSPHSSFSSAPDMDQLEATDEPVDEPIDDVDATTTTERPNTAQVELMDGIAAQDSMWSMSGERFINNPGHEDLPTMWVSQPQTPELDMTSAYAFQQSKNATEAGPSQLPRRVGIEDLLTQDTGKSFVATTNSIDDDPFSSVPDTPTIRDAMTYALFEPPEMLNTSSTKRTHEEAFADEDEENTQGILESDINNEHNSKEARSVVISDNESSVVPIDRAPLPQTEMEMLSLTIPARRDNVQPSKRRRFAQAASYAQAVAPYAQVAAYLAVGGAACLTYMVSTAPVL